MIDTAIEQGVFVDVFNTKKVPAEVQTVETAAIYRTVAPSPAPSLAPTTTGYKLAGILSAEVVGGDEGFVERPPNGAPPRLSAWELLNELHDPNVRRQMAVAQSLALQRMMLDDADFEALSNKLKWLPALRHVNLGSNFLTDEACLSIKMRFTRCGGLETLDFSHNALGKQSLLVLGTKLKQLRPLQRLCIEGNTPLAVTPNAGGAA